MELKVGLIARGEDRGLGIQSWEFHRAMRPERTLLVDLGEYARGFPVHADRYPDATIVDWEKGGLQEGPVREWLRGLDVVFSAETLYDWRLAAWGNEEGTATVVQLNPEFMRPVSEYVAPPTRWWAPTSWRHDLLPEGTRVVGVPVADDRFGFAPPERQGALRVLHSIGHAAHADRNGTGPLIGALPRVQGPMIVTIACQDRRIPGCRSTRGVQVVRQVGGVEDYWRAYDGQDVLVIPRRYGGLCLPVQEAMAAGLAVVMTDAEPQSSTWPIVPIPSRPGPMVQLPTGKLRPTNADPRGLASVLNDLARDAELVKAAQARSVAWAWANRWSVMRPLYEAELADACAA